MPPSETQQLWQKETLTTPQQFERKVPIIPHPHRPLLQQESELELEEQQLKRERDRNRVESAFRHKDRVVCVFSKIYTRNRKMYLQLHLVALNEPLDGNFGGIRGADLECYRQARQVNVFK